MKTCSKLSGKSKQEKKTDSFILTERPWANCHTIKIKIKRGTSCSDLPIEARETAKKATSCTFIVNPEQVMATLK